MDNGRPFSAITLAALAPLLSMVPARTRCLAFLRETIKVHLQIDTINSDLWDRVNIRSAADLPRTLGSFPPYDSKSCCYERFRSEARQ